MEDSSLPCSVITSHGEPPQTFTNSVSINITAESLSKNCLQPAYTVPFINMSADNCHPLQGSEALAMQIGDPSGLSDVAVFELVRVWPSNHSSATALQETSFHCLEKNVVPQVVDHELVIPRQRKRKIPYSPEHKTDKRHNLKQRSTKRTVRSSTDMEGQCLQTPDTTNGTSFSCDKCKSPYIINPSRSHLPNSQKKKHKPRKMVDPDTKKLLYLCNACGLAMARPKKQKLKQPQTEVENKEAYLKEASEFSAKLADSLKEPDAARLFCPTFKNKSCRCLQKYLNGNGDGEVELQNRATHLLTFIKDAKQLIKQKGNIPVTSQGPEDSVIDSTDEKDAKQKAHLSQGLKKRRCKLFEDFVLANRRYLREELHLCERACQKVLLYSNNFLHKSLKTSPNKGPRIERTCGKNARGLLKPITDLPMENCCRDKCVLIALSHSRLLESWRSEAALGQRQARRVLAEMLTPSGGTKANCYKFISMVTGCSYTTICLVSDQMKRTHGEREPPEHGLRKWWREHPRTTNKKKKQLDTEKSSKTEAGDEGDPRSWTDGTEFHIISEEELQSMTPQEVSSKLQQQRQKLLQLQKHIEKQQQKLNSQQQATQPSTSKEKTSELFHVVAGHSRPLSTMAVLADPALAVRSSSQQLLHILELPATTSVISSQNDDIQPQPTVSVMTASGEFEPISNIASATYLLPETSTEGHTRLGYTQSDEINFGTALESTEHQHQHMTTYDKSENSSKTNSFQLYSVVDQTAGNLLHFNY